MKRQLKKISMIFVIGLLIVSLNSINAEAKQVEVKKQTNPKVKIVFQNYDIDEEVKEIVFEIKNKTNSDIVVKKVEFQVKQNESWKSFETRKGVKKKRNMAVRKNNEAYDGILLKKNYKLPESGLPSGTYGVYVKYKYKRKYYFVRKTFRIQREEEDNNNEKVSETDPKPAPPPDNTSDPTPTPPPDNTSDPTPDPPLGNTPVSKPAKAPAQIAPSVPPATATVPKTIIRGASITGDTDALILLNYDFSINKKGTGRAMIFSEAHYAKTDKVKITLKVQKKYGKKWKKCKKYKIVKKSSVAFANREFKIKNSGTYRMSADITFYKNGKKQGGYRVKSKLHKF